MNTMTEYTTTILTLALLFTLGGCVKDVRHAASRHREGHRHRRLG